MTTAAKLSDEELNEAIDAATAVAAKVQCPAYLRDEVESAAVAAVGEAATRWDPDRGSFVPYARTRAWGAAVDFIRSWSPLSRGEWAAAAAEDVDAARVAIYQHSLSEPRGYDDTLGDRIEDRRLADPHAGAEARDLAIRLLAAMPEREALSVVLTSMLEWTQDEVGRVLGVSPSMVSKLASAGRTRAADPTPAARRQPLPPADVPAPGVDLTLTRREIEALALAARGMSAEAAGAEIGLSHWTVKTQRASLMRKLGAPNMAAAVDQGWRLGILASGV